MAARIYTRSGDGGATGLFGGERVPKDDLRVEAYGTVDELNAALGLACALGAEPEITANLLAIQHDLFTLGGDLAAPAESSRHKGRITIERVGPERTARLETLIDQSESELPPLKQFILPGGHPLAAHLHLARTICRRAERRVVTLANQTDAQGGEPVNPEIIRYLNRLSDLLFVLARLANHRLGVADVAWNAGN